MRPQGTDCKMWSKIFIQNSIIKCKKARNDEAGIRNNYNDIQDHRGK